ncbi:MAG TPA: TA system VapC family ribonuclease toxin [Polyangiaceae bacterium]|nr:TA system VapC family ribonuclease toxin [Polyangiaceae bacterium]
MIAVDTNLLVYAHRADSPFNPRAFECLSGLMRGKSPWAIPWPCIHEFFAIATHPRIYDPPTPAAKAVEQIEAWRESPNLLLLTETDDYWPVLRSLIESARVEGPRIHDARIAALCLAQGVSELWTADRDFSRFGLFTRNPLVETNSPG